MVKKIIKTFIASFTLLTLSVATAPVIANNKTIIFDLGDTLLMTDSVAAFNIIGIVPSICYSLSILGPQLLRYSEYLQKRLFAVLHTIEPRSHNETLTYSRQGLLLPQVMCSWMTGKRSSRDTLSLVHTTLKENPSYCLNRFELAMIWAITNMTFTPALFAKTQMIAPGALQLVRQCKDAGYELLILSNWDPESIELLVDRFPELFSAFDGIIISGAPKKTGTIEGTGVLKPDHRAYEAALTYGGKSRDPKNCIFIDDRPENIIAARECSLEGIQCPSSNKKPNPQAIAHHLIPPRIVAPHYITA